MIMKRHRYDIKSKFFPSCSAKEKTKNKPQKPGPPVCPVQAEHWSLFNLQAIVLPLNFKGLQSNSIFHTKLGNKRKKKFKKVF